MKNAFPVQSSSREDIEKLEKFLSFANSHKDESLIDKKNIETFFQKISDSKSYLCDFHKYISETSIQLVLGYWLCNNLTEKQFEQYSAQFRLLIEDNIFPLSKGSNALLLRDLKDKRFMKIIESIRCLKDHSYEDIENLVDTFITFAKDLSDLSMGYIPFDIDIEKVKKQNKIISYLEFMEFYRLLPKRDALVAALLYFNDPQLIEVLELQVSQVDFSANTISFGAYTVQYPTHIVNELKDLIQDRKNTDLVFVNRKGESVNRSRVFMNFKKASAKMNPPMEISSKELQEKKN